jgi:iron-sulfur cluster insertion protein
MISCMETVEGTTTKASPITLSDNAVSKLAALMAEETEPQALRIAVTGGGCSGFQYALGFDTEQHSDDLIYEQGGVRVIVDETSAEYLTGAVVDFQDGLNGKGFAIENPNSTGSCGCGQSFSC